MLHSSYSLIHNGPLDTIIAVIDHSDLIHYIHGNLPIMFTVISFIIVNYDF